MHPMRLGDDAVMLMGAVVGGDRSCDTKVGGSRYGLNR